MRRRFGLPANEPNFAWCFDCVPEENSLLFGFGSRTISSPALPVVHRHPLALLGRHVFETFGAEFPIRFDLLDTWEGGNLSLQVHPLGDYIRERFGMNYTQDESYYVLDAKAGAQVFLGFKNGLDPTRFTNELEAAQSGGASFRPGHHVAAWPSAKHAHFSIPAGTIHCSGRDNVVLEISATPYIFTFKLWDWGRLDLYGEPRPIHLEHGLANLQWERNAEWVGRNLIDRVRPVVKGDGWQEESTGLHPLEFIETRRHWFTEPVEHHTGGTVNVLNLVEGPAAVVESPSAGFEPFVVHYAETFVVPASVGGYRISPLAGAETRLATVKAYVREV
jgi:mannose-6-phosphate isomerase class I